MKKVICFLFIFFAIVSLLRYDPNITYREPFDFKGTLVDVCSHTELPSRPILTNYDFDISTYSDMVDASDNNSIFNRIGLFFVWLSQFFVKFFYIFKFIFIDWLLYFIRLLVYCITIIAKLFGGLLC